MHAVRKVTNERYRAIEKFAEILVKALFRTPDKRQTIQPDYFGNPAVDFKVTLPEKFLYEEH